MGMRAPFFWWAFTSTTDRVQYTSDFLGTGSRMLFMVQGVGVDVRRFSAFPTEGEVLMLPGTLLKLKGVLSQPGNLHIAQLVQQLGDVDRGLLSALVVSPVRGLALWDARAPR